MEWLKKILGGSKNARDLKNMGPMVDKINSFDESFISLNDQELKNKTNEFRERLNGGETLDDIKPEAFATVKNAARRLCGSTVRVCDHD